MFVDGVNLAGERRRLQRAELPQDLREKRGEKQLLSVRGTKEGDELLLGSIQV